MTRSINLAGTLPTIDRADLTLEENKVYVIPWASMGQTSDMGALPTAGDGTDLGLVVGTHGSASPSLQGTDFGGTTATEKVRFQVALPPEYVAGQPIEIRVRAGMLTTVSDTTATVDVECYKADRDAGVGSDLCTTSATSINSLTLADKDFSITPTGLTAGDLLDVEITATGTDSGNAGVMQIVITEVALKTDIKG